MAPELREQPAVIVVGCSVPRVCERRRRRREQCLLGPLHLEMHRAESRERVRVRGRESHCSSELVRGALQKGRISGLSGKLEQRLPESIRRRLRRGTESDGDTIGVDRSLQDPDLDPSSDLVPSSDLGPSRGDSTRLEAIGGHRRSSEAIREVIRGHQRGHQRPSGALSGNHQWRAWARRPVALSKLKRS